MNRVSVTLLIEPVNDIDNSSPYFGDSWDFTIGNYSFKKKNNAEVEISFTFEAELSKKDENYGEVLELPSEQIDEFQEYEEEIETILDLLSLQTLKGIRIKSRSYTFSSPGVGSSLPTSNHTKINFSDSEGLSKRFEKIKGNKDKNRRLINALRANRLSLTYEDPGDRIAKLWSIIEQLYGDEGGSIFSKEDQRLAIVKHAIDSLQGLTDPEKQRIYERVKNTQKITVMESLIKAIGWMNDQGILTESEKKKLLISWRSKRSSPAHGEILPKRSEEVQEILWDMEDAVQGMLYGEVTPMMICYILFHKNHVKKTFYETKGENVSRLGNYYTFAIRNWELEAFYGNLSDELIDEDSNIYIVAYDGVDSITRTEEKKHFNYASSPKELKKIIDSLRIKINKLR